MLGGRKGNSRERVWGPVIACAILVVSQLSLPSFGAAHEFDSQSLKDPRQLQFQYEVIHPLQIASIQEPAQYSLPDRAVTLFDLYLDEERPFIIGEASESIGDSVEVLDSHREARLSIETYCDQRNTTAYGMALGNQRTWQVKEFVEYLEIPPSKVLTVSYGKETLQCREKSPACWEEHVRVQSAFKYLAISRPKLGCLVRLRVLGVEKEFLPVVSFDQAQFLQKIKLAPFHNRRRLRQYAYDHGQTSLPHHTTAFR